MPKKECLIKEYYFYSAMDSDFIIEGRNEKQDISYPLMEECNELLFLEKAIPVTEFKDNTQKRKLKIEFRVRNSFEELILF